MVSRDPLVQGMLFDAGLKYSLVFYTAQFTASLVIIMLCTIFGKALFHILSESLSACVIVMVLCSIHLDLGAIDKSLVGDSEGAVVLDTKKSRFVKFSMVLQTVALLSFVLGFLK